MSEYIGHPFEHPIIYLNSIKNIIGDDKKTPSKILLDSLDKVSNSIPKREDDQKILNKVSKEGIGFTVFISDLEDACQTGNYKKMEYEAARLQSVSENGLSGLEVLIELGLQDLDYFGLFCFHLHRANSFDHNPIGSWHYTQCLLQELKKKKLPDPHENIDIKFELNPGLHHEKIDLLVSAYRMGNIDSVRRKGFNREISYWFSNQNLGIRSKALTSEIDSSLVEYINNGGDFYIRFAEQLIDTPSKIVTLDALRYLTNHGSPDHLPYIYNQLMMLKK